MTYGFPPDASSYASDIDGVIRFIWWIVFAWLLVAELLLLYLLIRYRRRKGTRAAWLPGKTLKAMSWVLVPCVFVLLFDLAIEVKSAATWHRVVEDIPKHDVLIRVTGRQFAWSFTYAGADGVLDTRDDFDVVNAIHVPVGKVVRVQLESVDVLHSFWIPALRLKQDIIPGRSIASWFEPTRLGIYEMGCAELCGALHTSMRATLTVESPDQYAAWAAEHAEQQARMRKVSQQ